MTASFGEETPSDSEKSPKKKQPGKNRDRYFNGFPFDFDQDRPRLRVVAMTDRVGDCFANYVWWDFSDFNSSTLHRMTRWFEVR